jgi:predicted RNase H-like HicB family nuclease
MILFCCNEPGNENKLISCIRFSGSSATTFACHLRNHFLNNETKKKFQSYHIMRFKDVDNCVHDGETFQELKQIVENIQMNGITSLKFSLPSPRRCIDFQLVYILPYILPKLREVDFSNKDVMTSGLFMNFQINALIWKTFFGNSNFVL